MLDASPPPAGSWRKSFLVEHFGETHLYSAVRTQRYSYVEHANGEREPYDMEADPYQLKSHAPPKLEANLHKRLKALKNCSGQDSCKAAERDVP
jgi:hypothetical protein